MGNDVVKTEINLSDSSVEKILAIEVSKIILKNETCAIEFVRQILNYRKPKEYRSNPDNPTMFEEILKSSLQPLIEEEIRGQANKYFKTIQKMIAKTFSSKVVKGGELEKKFIEALSEAMSKITFYSN